MDSNSRIQFNTEEAPRNEYREQKQKRHGMDKRSRVVAALAVILAVVLIIAIILPNSVFTVNNQNTSLAWFIDVTRRNIAGVFGWIGGDPASLIYSYTVYRYLIVAVTGAALAVSGAVYQGVFRNALASPTTLGVQSGGVLGGTVYIMLFVSSADTIMSYEELHDMAQQMTIFDRYGKSFAVILGCLAGVLFITKVSRMTGKGKMSSVTLILSGFVLGSVISSGVGLYEYYMLMAHTFDEKTYLIRYLMMGSYTDTYTLAQLLLIGVPILIGIGLLIAMRNQLNILVFSEDEARTMGIPVKRLQNTSIVIVTVMTAVVISFCGMIGFIGFITPHMARRLTGPDIRFLIPSSALVGSIVMVIVYYTASMFEISDNINFMTSLLGGGIFLLMTVSLRRRHNADWA